MTDFLSLAAISMFPFELFGLWTFLAAVLALVVNVFFALAIHRDAERIGGRLGFVNPLIWGAATLFGGILVVTAYWLMHHSNLSYPNHDAPAQPAGATDRDTPNS